MILSSTTPSDIFGRNEVINTEEYEAFEDFKMTH
jgi:hypothetical protein